MELRYFNFLLLDPNLKDTNQNFIFLYYYICFLPQNSCEDENDDNACKNVKKLVINNRHMYDIDISRLK